MEENKHEIMIENLAERVGFELHPVLKTLQLADSLIG